MEDNNLKDAVKEAVLEHLPLSEEDADNLADFLISLGITAATQLYLIKECDLVPRLKAIQARTLLEGWSTKYGKGISWAISC